MKQPKLKIRFEKWECAVVMQVLDMDERFRFDRSREIEFQFISKNGMLVDSLERPFLSDSYINLLGCSRTRDFVISYKNFNSNEERDEYFNRALEALQDLAENWEGFNGEPTKMTEENGVFTFK